MIGKKILTSVIIPAYNEERNITSVIKDVQKLSKKYNLEIIIVDDGSKDKTAKVAKSAGADRVISYQKNKGKGGAFRVGIDNAKGDYIVQIDADHQFQPKEIPLFIKALDEGYDVAVGTRFDKGKVEEGSVSKVNLFGNWLMSFNTTFFSGIKVTDIMAGFKAFTKEAAKKLDLQTSHFGYEAETIVKSGKLGLKVTEIPITYTKRIFGTSGVSAIRDGTKVSYTIAKMYFTFPGPPPGQGVVGKRLIKTSIPIWLFLIIPIISYLSQGQEFNIITLSQIFYSMLFALFIWLLTRSFFASLLGSSFFAISNIFTQLSNLPSELFISSKASQNPNYFFFSLLTLSILISLFLQDRKIIFLKSTLITLVIFYLLSFILPMDQNTNLHLLFNLELIIICITMAYFFWNLERWISLSFATTVLIFVFSLLFRIPFSGLLGASVFFATLSSSLMLELLSFRKFKDPLLSKRRIFLFILLVLFILNVLFRKYTP